MPDRAARLPDAPVAVALDQPAGVVGHAADRPGTSEAVVAGNRAGVGEREDRSPGSEADAGGAIDEAAIGERADRPGALEPESNPTARSCGAAVGEGAERGAGNDDGVVTGDRAGVLDRADAAAVRHESPGVADQRPAGLILKRADRAARREAPVAGDPAGVGDRVERTGGLVQDAVAGGRDRAGVDERGGGVGAGGDHASAGGVIGDGTGARQGDRVAVAVDRPGGRGGDRCLGGRRRRQQRQGEEEGRAESPLHRPGNGFERHRQHSTLDGSAQTFAWTNLATAGHPYLWTALHDPLLVSSRPQAKT